MRSCRACGAQAPDEARFCPTCGTNYEAPQAPTGTTPGWTSGPAPPTPAPSPAPFPGPGTGFPAPPPPAPWTLPAPARPLGVTIMSLWNLGGGLLALLFGAVLLIAGPALLADPELRGQAERDLAEVPGGLDILAGALAASGVYFLLTGVAMLATGYGMWQGKPWSHTVMLGLAALWLLTSLLLFPAGLLGAALAGFLLWYFTRDGVKRWFGKGSANEPGLPGYVPPPSPPPGMPP